MNNNGSFESNDIVEIKLKKWQVPFVLGALDLGMRFEYVCRVLSVYVDTGRAISELGESLLWQDQIEKIINEINDQTEIDLGYAVAAKSPMSAKIFNLVDSKIEDIKNDEKIKYLHKDINFKDIGKKK